MAGGITQSCGWATCERGVSFRVNQTQRQRRPVEGDATQNHPIEAEGHKHPRIWGSLRDHERSERRRINAVRSSTLGAQQAAPAPEATRGNHRRRRLSPAAPPGVWSRERPAKVRVKLTRPPVERPPWSPPDVGGSIDAGKVTGPRLVRASPKSACTWGRHPPRPGKVAIPPRQGFLRLEARPATAAISARE